MRVAVTGASGLIGNAVARELRGRGDEVLRLVRARAAARAPDAVYWDPAAGIFDGAGLRGTDAVLHFAAESLLGVWTPAKRRRIVESRVHGTNVLSRAVAGLEPRPAALVCASAVGFYGERPDQVDESAPPGTGFLADLARRWERAADPARAAGTRVVHLRFAVVLSPRGGVLGLLLPLFRLGLGGRVGSGDQPFPWVALEDVQGAVAHVLDDQRLEGPVNVAAPEPTTMRQFVARLAAVLGRPAPFAVPAPVARLVPGGMAQEMILGGAHVVPRRLLQTGYRFRRPELDGALRRMLGEGTQEQTTD